jgi:antitoxin (DNA-binding transcriptional repressor) of toxin-antitoxin stability system
MTKTMTALECKAKFLDALDQVGPKGERIIVTRDGKPIAGIIPFVERPKTLRRAMRDSITILGDLDEPLDVRWPTRCQMGSARRPEFAPIMTMKISIAFVVEGARSCCEELLLACLDAPV